MGFWSGLASGIGSTLGSVKDTIFGGQATKGIDVKPEHYGQATDQLGTMAVNAGNRQAPTAQAYQMGPAYQLNAGQADQSRAGMAGVANRLGGIASGTQAGAGELAVNRQVDSATAAQQAAAHIARGANAALAMRNAARNTMDIGLAGAGQAAQAQMGDQAQANAQLGQLYGQMRSGDVDVAGQNAQLGQQAMIQQAQMGQQTALANMQAQLAQTGMNDQQQIAAMGQMLGWDQAKINAELQRAAIASGDKGILSGILQAGGAALATKSDERLKTDIADGSADVDDLLSKLKAKSYRYKNPADGEGLRLGIMAQDLAKSKMGAATLVKVDDEHLGFDNSKAISASLASIARLHERLSKLESGA